VCRQDWFCGAHTCRPETIKLESINKFDDSRKNLIGQQPQKLQTTIYPSMEKADKMFCIFVLKGIKQFPPSP
jgi:hypothetical protein